MMFPMMSRRCWVGFQFKFLFNDNIGFVNNALAVAGLTDRAIPWLIRAISRSSRSCRRGLVVDRVFAILILAGCLPCPSIRSSGPCRRLHALADLPLCQPGPI